MHQQRLVLNGPPAAVARLADDLRAAGAVAVAGPTAGPPRLVWETARPATLEGLCAHHRAVAVGVERFELLGDELQRLVVQGADATVLERRRLPAAGDGPDGLDDFGGPGLCLDEDGAPLDLAALRAAARRVLAAPVAPAPARSALDDAVLAGAAVGRLCAAAAAVDAPDAATREAIATLAAVTLTLGAAGSSCARSAASSVAGA
jgi:hypothetical protein